MTPELATAAARARALLERAAAPAPEALAVLECACDARELWDPAFARARTIAAEIRAGVRDIDGRTVESAVRSANRGRYNAGWRCPECNHLTSRKRGPCGCSCGCTAVMGSVSCPEALDTR